MKQFVYFLAFILTYSIADAAKPPVIIEITRGQVQPDPVAVIDFTNAADNVASTIGVDISNVITNDLYNCGLFAPIAKTDFIQAVNDVQSAGINFAKWQTTKARFIVTGRVILNSSPDQVTVEFRLFDVLDKKQMIGKSVSGGRKNWRRLAHAVADLIYSRITNEAGFFNTQVVYSEPVNKGKKSSSRLMRMDYDGHGVTAITDSKHLALTPRYSPTGKEIAYLKIHGRTAEVVLINLNDKSQRKLGTFDGMNFAPRFSPDAGNIVMSLTKGGSTAIYTMNTQSKKMTRLTDHLSIDTSPCYSPDGTQIAFTSDRSGKENIYIMNTMGSDVRRVSFSDGKYSQPVWSPRGDLIAFTKQVAEGDSKFYIGVMAPDGTGERMIAAGWLVEAPCWSANGRYLLFSKQNSVNDKSQLHMVDLTGYNLRSIKTPKEAQDGAWSPLLQ
ncbi:MAG: Tol-Pal system beta propeller repeat protein TolB [Candidatus Paracaedibacteraceae bacterium]|nr:Tol-Pal system beta propeller repeat protein TolB [Candidatus Paracaedibacteraceae bacterium]